MKDFFPASVDQKHGCAVYVGAHYTRHIRCSTLSRTGWLKDHGLQSQSLQGLGTTYTCLQ